MVRPRLLSNCSALVSRWAPYGLTIAIVLTSYLIWFRFNDPPIGSNSAFVLFPWRHVALSTSLFDPYYWPGSFTPQAFGTPYELYLLALLLCCGRKLLNSHFRNNGYY